MLTYTYKNNNYLIIDSLKMKHPVTREWIDAILYTSSVDHDEPTEMFVREKEEFFKLFKRINEIPVIPYHIQVMGKLYNVIDDDKNLAKGEIKKFDISKNKNYSLHVGKVLTCQESINDEDHFAMWINLGNDYFKLIGLWKDHS